MFDGFLTDRFVGIAERSMLIDLILEKIRIDGAGTYAVAIGQFRDIRDVIQAAWKIPQYVQGDGGTDASQCVHLTRIAERFLGCGRGSSLYEFPKPSTRVGKPPGRDFYTEGLKRSTHHIFQLFRHKRMIA